MTESEAGYTKQALVRGRLAEELINLLKQAQAKTNLAGFLIAVFGLFWIVYTVLEAFIGASGNTFESESVSLIAALVGLSYATWLGWSAYHEYAEIDRARKISQRPSIGTAVDAFDLLASTDATARQYASHAVAEIVSLGPEKIVNEIAVEAEELVSYLLPLLDDTSSETRENVASTIRLFTRDYPDAVASHQETLLEILSDDRRTVDVRSEMAMSVGYLALSGVGEANQIETKATELLDHSNAQLRIGACYMLAGVGSQSARERLAEVAQHDPDNEVREHAEVLR